MILFSQINPYDIISTSTNLLLVIPIVIAATTQCRPAAQLAVGTTATALIGEALKTTLFSAYKRPRGARDCDPLCREGPCEHKPGMPSTHAAISAFFVYWVAKITYKNFSLTAAATAYYLLVLLARYKKRCHSVAQLAAGSALGFGLAALFFATGI